MIPTPEMRDGPTFWAVVVALTASTICFAMTGLAVAALRAWLFGG